MILNIPNLHSQEDTTTNLVKENYAWRTRPCKAK